MNSRRYILDERGEPVPCKDLLKWAAFIEDESRRVAREEVAPGIEVSTVFLGLDHNFSGQGPPVLWETMVFCDARNHKWSEDATRCAGGREQAEAMHAAIVERLRAALALKA